MEQEQDKINFLDIIIQRTENNLIYSIYRKSTVTDTIIHNILCHPIQHKMSAINYMINRLNTYPMKKNERNTEVNTIKYILQQTSTK
jgi:hypothetical protein